MRPVGDGQRRVCYAAPSLPQIRRRAGRHLREREARIRALPRQAPGATPLLFVRAKMVMSLAWSGFQSTIRDLIPRFETSPGFCGSYMLLPAAQGRFAASARPPPDPLTKDIDGGR